jgi:uncharacterized repeat protein (TIGR03803 family)
MSHLAVQVGLITALVVTAVPAPVAQAQTANFNVLYNFCPNGGFPCSDGAFPEAGLIRDDAGNLYGTVRKGGDAACSYPYGCGVVFEVSPDGTETVLHAFTGPPDGSFPQGALLRDAMGNLYGTTSLGGDSKCAAPDGCGVVFKLDGYGKETILYAFKGGLDGCIPEGGVVQDGTGSLYGSTFACGAYNFGTVFEVSKHGTETVLHTFAGSPNDGAVPEDGRLLLGKGGKLYGTTTSGGSGQCNEHGQRGCGTVFQLSANHSGRWSEKLLHSFAANAQDEHLSGMLANDGLFPYGKLAIDDAENLYGTTLEGGSAQSGTVWKLTKRGSETILYNFNGSTDGSAPFAGVVRDSEGNLYGDTSTSPGGGGMVYELNNIGSLTVLHNFSWANGEYLQVDLLRDPKGTLYGTASDGGSGCCGTVWSLGPQ